MKLLTLLVITLLSVYANAETIYQCAVDKVVPHGVRVNVIETNGKLRANLIFGTTVSGTMYSVERTADGYAGEIKNKPDFTLALDITSNEAENSNIRGYRSHLKAVYPTLENENGYDVIDANFVCGEKISEQWQ